MPKCISEAGLDFSDHITSLFEEVRQRIALQTDNYAGHTNQRHNDKQFEVGDRILIRLHSKRFALGSFNKLHARRAGPFPILKKLGSNAYIINPPSTFNISPVLNAEDLTEFCGEES